MVAIVLFWLFLVLGLLGIFAPDTWPNINRGRFVILLLMIALLGYHVFGSPVSR